MKRTTSIVTPRCSSKHLTNHKDSVTLEEQFTRLVEVKWKSFLFSGRSFVPKEGEDVVQSGLSTAWRHIEQFDPDKGSLLNFIYSRIRSAGSNRRKYHLGQKRAKFITAAPLYDAEGIEIPLENRGRQNTPSAEDMAIIEEGLDAWKHAGLSKDEATILGLRASGYTEKEVGAMVDIKSTDVKYQVKKARKKLNDLTR
mgnify:FL=1